MSDRLKVRANEQGVIRLFAIDKAAEPPIMSAEKDWDADPVDPPWPLRDALGVEYLDSDFIELFDVADLEGVGLAGYLVEGLGVAEAEVAPHRAQLDAIKGMVLIVLSHAFGKHEVTLTPRSPLKWVGTFSEERRQVRFDPLHSEAATERAAPQPEAEPESAGPNTAGIAAIVLMALTLLVFALLVWVRF